MHFSITSLVFEQIASISNRFWAQLNGLAAVMECLSRTPDFLSHASIVPPLLEIVKIIQ